MRWLLPLAPSLLERADTDGETPLVHTCAGGHAELAAWLLEQGARPTKAAATAGRDHYEVSKLLKKALKKRAAAGDEGASGTSGADAGSSKS